MINIRFSLSDRSGSPDPFGDYTVESLRRDWLSKMFVQPPDEYLELLAAHGGQIFDEALQVRTKPPHLVHDGDEYSAFSFDCIMTPHEVAGLLDANLDDTGEVFPMAFFTSNMWGDKIGIWCGGGDKFVDGYVYVVPRFMYPGFFEDLDKYPPWEYLVAGFSLQDFFDNAEPEPL